MASKKGDQLSEAQLSLPVQLSRHWHALKGMAYGIPQPVMTGRLIVRGIEHPVIDQLEVAFSSCLTEEQPDWPSSLAAVDRLAHLLCYWIGALQRSASIAVSEKYHVVRQPDRSEKKSLEFAVALPTLAPTPTSATLKWATESVNRLVSEFTRESSLNLDAFSVSFHDFIPTLNSMVRQGVNDFHLMHAVNRLHIPVQRSGGRLLMLGTGQYVRWMASTVTDQTNPMGIDLLADKQRTAAFLNSMGLPGVKHRQVANAEEAVQAATELGYPVVIKPVAMEKGIGVYADLPDEKRLRRWFETVLAVTDQILVEKHVVGKTHRLTVFQGEVIRVLRRSPGGVTGDGVHNVKQLVELWHADVVNQRRAQRLGGTLLGLDEEALDVLDQDGRSAEFLPADGEFVRLRRRDNINTGGSNEYLTMEQVHPDNLQLARDIAKLLKMDFVGVDLISPDIGKSWQQTGGAICELNARPQMGVGNDKTLYERVLARFMGRRCRVFARLVIHDKESKAIADTLNNLEHKAHCNAVSGRDGLLVDARKVSGPFVDGFTAARALSIRPDVTGMSCLMSLDEVVADGLPLDRWDSIQLLNYSGNRKFDEAGIDQLKSIVNGHIEGEIGF